MNIRTYTHLLALGLLAFLAYVPATYAASNSNTFNVTATVDPVCTITNTHELAFGLYTGSQKDRTAQFDVTCTNGTAYTVGLDNGLHSASCLGTRCMEDSSGHFLGYQLFSNIGRTLPWNGVNTVAGSASQTLTVYGRIPTGTPPPAGPYTDTIVVTVNF